MEKTVTVSLPTKHLPALLACLLLAACAPPQKEGTPVAKAGATVLMLEDLKNQLPPTAVDGEQAAQLRREWVEDWVWQELLYQEALERQLHKKPRIERLIEQARRDLLIATLLDDQFEGREVQIDTADIQTYYQSHQERFIRTQAEMRARHILLGSKRDANARYKALTKGESFEDAVEEYSIDEDTKRQQGDLGYFSAEDDPILWEASEKLKLNALSKPVASQLGYHIIQVLDRQEAGSVRQLDLIRADIVETLVRQEHQVRIETLLDELKASREWAVFAEPLERTP